MIAIVDAHWNDLKECKEVLSPFRQNKDLYKALRKRLEDDGIDDADPEIIILEQGVRNKQTFAVIGYNSEGHGGVKILQVQEYENA
jgi:hypothetical protein